MPLFPQVDRILAEIHAAILANTRAVEAMTAAVERNTAAINGQARSAAEP